MNERDIFQAAVEIGNPVERTRFLDEACGNQPVLRSHVEALLRHHEDAGSFLERPPAELEGTRFFDEVATDENSLAPGTCTSDGMLNDETLRSYLAPSETPGVLGTLDQYEVLEKLGQGGMGVVLKAKDTKLERIVAIKLLAPELASNPMARKRFSREAKAAAAVTHDHIVRIYAVSDSPPIPMLVMECIVGQSLQQKIDRTGALEVKEILRIGLQAALGLAAAHKQGLVHRDIKPANILLENGIERVKITDFGLARAVDDIGMTRTGQITGTPQYMSPEQAQGDLMDYRSDLFSLGSVLYAMCTGRAAFRADSTVAVLRRVCDDQPRPIPEINPEIPLPLVDIVEQLMEKNPEDRIQSADDVAEALSGLLAQIQQPGNALSTPIVRYQKPEFQTQSLRQRFSALVFAKLVLALAVVLLVVGITEATGVTQLAKAVIRIATGEGTLVIEVDDPTATVALDGDEVVLSAEGLKEFRLKPGEHGIMVNRPGQPVQRQLVQILRNGQTAIVISQDGTGIRTMDKKDHYPTLSPFEAIRWNGLNPEVKLNDNWYKLTGINGVTSADIVRFAIERYESKWQKRFDEDLVQVMTEMGQRPGYTVDLTVVNLTDGRERTLENVAMTEANRRAIYLARWKAEKDREEPMAHDGGKTSAGKPLSEKLRRELALAIKAGNGELTDAELKTLSQTKHSIPDLLELPVSKQILELLGDLPEESHKQLVEQGYLKWPHAGLNEHYRKSFLEIVEMLLKQAQDMGFGGKSTSPEIMRQLLNRSDVGFAAIDYSNSQQAITFYVLTSHSPVPIGMPIVPENPKDWDSLELGLPQFDQLKKLAEKPNSPFPKGPDASLLRRPSKISIEQSQLLVKGGFRPTWTPDGNQILYSGLESSSIELYDLTKGQSESFLTVSDLDPNQVGKSAVLDAAISPDGNTVAAVLRPFAKGNESYLQEEIWAVPFSEGATRGRIGLGGYPCFGKESTLMYFQDRKRNMLCSVRLDSDAKPQDVMPCAGWYPAISPDGQWLAYSMQNELFIASLQTGEVMAKWKCHEPASGMIVSWSPDSKRVGACPYSPQSRLGFWCYDLDQKQAVEISRLPIGEVAWSPDGKQLAYTIYLEGPKIYVISTDKLPGLLWPKATPPEPNQIEGSSAVEKPSDPGALRTGKE